MKLSTLRTWFWSRPPRLAVFFDSAVPGWDPSWIPGFRRMIGAVSELWGGLQFIFVPTSGARISELWLSVLRAYDPDVICAYRVTGADVRQALGTKWEEHQRKRLASTGTVYPEDAVQEYLKDAARRKFRVTWAKDDQPYRFFAPGHTEQIRAACAPFEFQLSEPVPADFAGTISLDEPAFYRTVPMALLISSKMDQVIRCWDLAEYSEHLGVYSESFIGGVNTSRFKVVSGSLELVNTPIRIVSSKPDSLFQVFLTISARDKELGGPPHSSSPPFPFDLTRYQVEQTWQPRGSKRFGSLDDLGLFLVVGSTVEDFALFYALSRMRTGVFWLPADAPEDLRDVVLAIAERRQEDLSGSDQGSDCVTSASLTREDTLKVLESTWNVEVTSQVFGALGPIRKLAWCAPEDMTRCLVERAFRVRAPVAQHVGLYVSGVASTSVPPPIPDFFRGLLATEVCWVGEFFTDGFQPPSRVSMTKLLAGGSQDVPTHLLSPQDPSFIRMGKLAECRILPGSKFLPAVPVEQFVQPIQPVRPSDALIFQTLINEAGYLVELSDKGRYAEATVELLGGLKPAVEVFFGNQDYRRIFAAFCAPKDKDKNSRKPGRWIPSDGRRVLSAMCAATALKPHEAEPSDPQRGLALLERLTKRGAATRGLVITCNRCARTTWYGLAEVGHQFNCKYCGYTQVLRHDQLRPVTQGGTLVPFYRLDEMVAQTWSHHGDLPLRALYRLSLVAKHLNAGFHYSHEINLRTLNDGAPFELDLLTCLNGRLIAGECKAAGGRPFLQKAQLHRFRTLLSALKIDMALLVTDAEAWAGADRHSVTATLVQSGIRTWFWQAEDLQKETPTIPLL